MTLADSLEWLLGLDNPSARYQALVGLLDRQEEEPEVVAARSAIPAWGPARAILDAQWPEGYWMRPGLGYSPKYKATVWQVIFWAALGGPRIEAIDRACSYVLEHSRLPDGRFSAYRTDKGAIVCLNGNLLRALLQLGCDDTRIAESLEALAGMVAHDRFRCRFNPRNLDQGPPPARMSDGLPCAWGVIKALDAFAQVPAEHRSSAMRAAVRAGVEFLLSGDLAAGDYPSATGSSPLWHRFGFPLGYTSDLLEALHVLAQHGVKSDPRLGRAMDVVLDQRHEGGRWSLGYTPENTWASFGRVGQPNKWVTLRALRVLKDWEGPS